MKLFEDKEEIKLLKYLPQFMQGYIEFKGIASIENEILDYINKESIKAFRNSFMFKMDENGALEFEKMMNIVSVENTTLKQRLNEIYRKWNSNIPYNWRWLLNFLSKYFEDTDVIAIPEVKEYDLFINFICKNLTDRELDLIKILRGYIPANLVINLVRLKEINYNHSFKSYKFVELEREIKPQTNNKNIDTKTFKGSFLVKKEERIYGI